MHPVAAFEIQSVSPGDGNGIGQIHEHVILKGGYLGEVDLHPVALVPGLRGV